MDSKSIVRCCECIFSQRAKMATTGERFECHRMPPRAVDRIHTMYPECKPEWWCAEGIRKTARKVAGKV